MEHLLYEPTVGGECNVCGMVLNFKFYSTTKYPNELLLNFFYALVVRLAQQNQKRV